LNFSTSISKLFIEYLNGSMYNHMYIAHVATTHIRMSSIWINLQYVNSEGINGFVAFASLSEITASVIFVDAVEIRN
jgi:hypothetical protein